MGSTCQVWEGLHTTENRRYALKVLRPDLKNDRIEFGFLKHEYAVAEKLRHKSIIRISDFVTEYESPFLVLELFSELNVKQALRQGTDSVGFMLGSIVEQMVESLYFMHSKGWVHCDVKPDNFLISRDGEIRLIDFTISQKISSGLAKMFKIKTKQISGTRSYMSPEQIRGLPLDPRSDIYSLGCVFYELTTGKPPFTGESPNDLLNKHISAPIPSPAVADDNVTSDFCDLVRNMMAKSVDKRPESMWDILKLLRGIRIFKRPPRIPERLIFDDFPMAGRIATQAQSEATAGQLGGADGDVGRDALDAAAEGPSDSDRKEN